MKQQITILIINAVKGFQNLWVDTYENGQIGVVTSVQKAQC